MKFGLADHGGGVSAMVDDRWDIDSGLPWVIEVVLIGSENRGGWT